MFKELLISQRETIIDRWIALTLESYPEETRKIYASTKDRFTNPSGFAITDGLAGLYNELVNVEKKADDLGFNEFLDKIIRLRAVQQFSPARAMGFIFLLKNAVREVLFKQIQENGLFGDLLTFESQVDSLALLSFNIYCQCREALFDIRANEIRSRVSRILDRACQKYGMPHEWAESLDENNDIAIKPR